MYRKLWMILALAALLCALCCASAAADSSGTCGTNVTWSYNSSSGKLTISGTGAMDGYSNATNIPWYSFKDDIRSVEIKDGITSVGQYAFYYARSLTSVSLPKSVTRLNNGVFNGCESLAGVTIPYGVTFIGRYAFKNCVSLTKVTIPDSVAQIMPEAFANCTHLAEAVILNRNCAIGDGNYDVFTGCSSSFVIDGWMGSTAQTYANNAGHRFGALTARGSCGDNVNWSFNSTTGQLTISGTGAMYDYFGDTNNCPWSTFIDNIKSLTIEDGVTSVGKYAFYYANALASVTLPDNSLTRLEYGAFCGCGNLTSIVIPHGVTVIDSYAFYRCSSLTEMTIPGSVTAVGGNAFAKCTGLTGVTILNHRCTIGDSSYNVFADGSNAFVLHGWPGSTANTYASNAHHTFAALAASGSCGDNVTWSYNSSSGKLTISGTGAMDDYYNDTTDRPWHPFIKSIKSVTIEEGVTSVGQYAFYFADAIISVTLPSTLTRLEYGAFCGCRSLAGIDIPYGVTFIDRFAFNKCESLTKVTIPSSVAYIMPKVFANCTHLAEAIILNRDCIIGDSNYDVFTGCSSPFDIDGWMGSTAQTYAKNAGHGFWALPPSGSCGDNVTWFLDSVTGTLRIYGTGAMQDTAASADMPWYDYRYNIQSVVIESGVTTVTPYAFYRYTNLTSITFPGTLTSIGKCSFRYDSGLTNVVIPDSVTSIGYLTFADCLGLTRAAIMNPDCLIGDDDRDVFNRCCYLTLNGWIGSTAEVFARAKNIPFLPLDDPDFVLPSSLTTIEADAFRSIDAVTVYIPDGVTSISGDPFAGSSVRYIYGASGSAAEDFADDYGYIFVPYMY